MGDLRGDVRRCEACCWPVEGRGADAPPWEESSLQAWYCGHCDEYSCARCSEVMTALGASSGYRVVCQCGQEYQLRTWEHGTGTRHEGDLRGGD